MSLTLRVLVAAALVAVAAFFGAAFIGFHSGLSPSPAHYGGAPLLASLDLSPASGEIFDEQMVDDAYRQVQRYYYQPFNGSTLVSGERKGLESYLATKIKAEKPRIPAASVSPGSTSGDLQALNTQLSYADDHYAKVLGASGDTQLMDAALDGMLKSLDDPYTVYLTPREIRQLNESLDGGNFGGIGVYIQETVKGSKIVLTPIQGLPAWNAGMRTIEFLQRINGKPVTGMSLDAVEHVLRGPEGTTVTLTARPYDKKTARNFHITRAIIHVPTVYAKYEAPWEYIRLSDFGETSADEIHKALEAGVAHHAKGFILDLRDNGGGLLDAAVSISSYWVPKGEPIVTEIDRAGERQTQDSYGDIVQGDRPLAILVNGYTASASEITSGALQDYHLATLIGTKTFGKGVVQGIFEMPNGGALKITQERYVTPAGRDIEHKGIVPNIIVKQSVDPTVFNTSKDRQLNAAKAFLSHMVRSS